MAKTTSSTGYEPDVIDNFDYSVTSETFLQEQSSDTMPSYLHDAELSDETIGKALSSPLFIQEREASASLLQAFTHKEKACFNVHSQFFLQVRGNPSPGCHRKGKSNQELDNYQFRIILEREKEQLLAEAKSEILRHEYRADLAEKKICELKRQIDSQALEMGHVRTGYEQSRREQALLHEELADRERALRDSRVGGIQELEELKREQEFRLEEFSIRTLVEFFLRCRICTQWTIISRSNSTSIVNQEDC